MNAPSLEPPNITFVSTGASTTSQWSSCEDIIESLRQRLGVPYQLAHERPFVSGRRLVREAQEEAGIDGEFALVAEAKGSDILSAAAQEFFERVTWEHDTAVRWRPDASREESPVVIDPDVRFGAPSVGGISSEILWEQSEGGDDDQDFANIFGLTLAQVRWARRARRLKQPEPGQAGDGPGSHSYAGCARAQYEAESWSPELW